MNKDADTQEMAIPWIEERGWMDTSFPGTSDEWLALCADKYVGGLLVCHSENKQVL